MNKIIALWTHPRSISTAFERVMMERGDLNILHEPFSYFYYVQHQDKASISQESVDPGHPTNYPEIREHIRNAAEKQPVFFKDMCSHCYEELAKDDAFLSVMSNTFLIRDPAKAIASYYAMNKNVTLDEIGLEQLAGIFKQVSAISGKTPIVVDADDLEDNPDGTIKAYCEALKIPFIPEAMTWKEEHKEQWDIWKEWHKDAAKSSGITKNMEKFEVTVENSAHLRKYYDYHLPFYQSMYKHRIQPV